MIYSKKDMDKILNEYNKYSYKCSCGHTVVIFPKEEKSYVNGVIIMYLKTS